MRNAKGIFLKFNLTFHLSNLACNNKIIIFLSNNKNKDLNVAILINFLLKRQRLYISYISIHRN